jgi:hypothetical protein
VTTIDKVVTKGDKEGGTATQQNNSVDTEKLERFEIGKYSTKEEESDTTKGEPMRAQCLEFKRRLTTSLHAIHHYHGVEELQ